MRDKKGRFVDGESGNPRGRPKKGQTLTDVMREYLDKKAINSSKTNKEELIEKAMELAKEGNLAALKLLWNYVDGMPRQSIDLEGGMDNKLEIKVDYE